MSGSLRCPYCAAEFDLAAWRRAATCPTCGRRVRFEAATAAAQAAGETAAARGGGTGPPAAVPVSSLRPPPPRVRTLLGKPLVWTPAWTVVVIVWALSAVGMAAVRLDMGHIAVLNARERGAITAVEKAELEPDVPYAQALSDTALWLGGHDPRPLWQVQDRPWERRVYVSWELGDQVRLGWTVGYDGAVRAGDETTLFLKQVVRAGPPPAQPSPLPTSLPTGLPGL
jgi:hypothetical protein